MSASRTRACGTSLAYTSDVKRDRHGVRHHHHFIYSIHIMQWNKTKEHKNTWNEKRTTRQQGALTVSKLGCIELSFVEPGVNINGVYYRDVLLSQKLLPVIRRISGNYFVFQQDSTPAHRARETIELLRRETRRTLFHQNSGHRTVQILTRWTTKSGL